MRIFPTAILSVVLAAGLYADDKTKDKGKTETIDPVTGEKTKTKYKVKSESDGDYKADVKSETKGVEGKTKTKQKIRGEDDGDYKEHTTVKGPDGKSETKTKIDK